MAKPSMQIVADEGRVGVFLENKDAGFVDRKDVPLSGGMSVNARIKTGDRRIIEYVLSSLEWHKGKD